MRMPPWLCVIALGSPVVPEENKIHSGCPNGTCSNSNPAAGTGGWSISASHVRAPGTGLPSGPGTCITCLTLPSAPMTCAISAPRS